MYGEDLGNLLTRNNLFYECQLHFSNYNNSVGDGVFESHKQIEDLETVLNYYWNRSGKVFTNEPSKICERQPLKILRGPFLNSLSQMAF